MTAIATPKRRATGAKRADTSDLGTLMRTLDRRLWTVLAVVIKPDDAASHYEIYTDDLGQTDLLVHVETQPDQQDLTCRLAVAGGGSGIGFWAVPAVGAEVAVIVPDGEIAFMPTIVGVLSSGALPARVGPDRVVLVSTVPIEITAPTVLLGPNPAGIVAARDGLVHGDGIDPWTGAKYFALSNTSAKVLANK